MKTNLTTLTLLIGIALTAATSTQAQTTTSKTEKSKFDKKEKAEHLKHHLMLDDKTSAKFDKLYTKYKEEIATANKKAKEKIKEAPPANLSEEELDAAVLARIDRNIEVATIQKKYQKEFKSILNSRQLYTLFQHEMHNGTHYKTDRQKGTRTLRGYRNFSHKKMTHKRGTHPAPESK